MSAEQNKEMVKATWTAFGKGDLKTAFGNMADNVSWLIPGNIPGTSASSAAKMRSSSSWPVSAVSFRKA